MKNGIKVLKNTMFTNCTNCIPTKKSVKEQELIENYDKIIFQFPFYWFNCPPLFKKWLGEVLTYGWAYGSKSGYKVSGKKIALAISAIIDQHEYSRQGKYKYTLEQLTSSFELTFEYIKADYKGFFAYYGIELNSSEEWVEKSVPAYIYRNLLNFIENNFMDARYSAKIIFAIVCHLQIFFGK